MDKSSRAQGAAALRDFFASVNAGDMRSAASDIALHFNLPLDAATNWTEVEYDFNRLFVGPAAVPAPPYASAYQDEPLLMGEPALKVREAYGRLGLAVPDQGATPDDHLAFELDAVVAMESLAAAESDLVQLKSWLIAEHMGGWVPKFAEAVSGQEHVSAPVAMATRALVSWLDGARAEAGAVGPGKGL